MAVANETRPQRFGTAVAAGLVGGIAMGVLLQATTAVLPMIGAIVGLDSLLGGWLVHLTISVLFAVGFVGVLSATPLTTQVTDASDMALLGAVYGGVVGIVTVGVVLPVAIAAAGTGANAGGAVVPFGVPLESFFDVARTFGAGIALGIAHLVYGVTMGVVVGVRHERVPELSGVGTGN